MSVRRPWPFTRAATRSSGLTPTSSRRSRPFACSWTATRDSGETIAAASASDISADMSPRLLHPLIDGGQFDPLVLVRRDGELIRDRLDAGHVLLPGKVC